MSTNVGDREVALGNEILRTVVGSTVHGMEIEGTDDRDEMGVYLETPFQLLGLEKSSEHYVHRTQSSGDRSGPGDLDLTLYSLRKWMRLATQGNPTVLTVLYAPGEHVLVNSGLGRQLRGLAPRIISKNAGFRFLGYLEGQRERLLGGGKQNRVPSRLELIEAHGYDTKYASHALRLGYQGYELVTTGHLMLPLAAGALGECMEVKRGEVGFEEAVRRITAVHLRLEHSVRGSGRNVLQDKPDLTHLNYWMSRAHREKWGWL